MVLRFVGWLAIFLCIAKERNWGSGTNHYHPKQVERKSDEVVWFSEKGLVCMHGQAS
jgi:hypothetical protein